MVDLLLRQNPMRILVTLIHAPWMLALRLYYLLRFLDTSNRGLLVSVAKCQLYVDKVIIILKQWLHLLRCSERR